MVANVATLLQSITLSGSRLSDGTPNQTGTLNAYLPGTLTPTTIWSDPAGTVAVTQPVTLDNGGRIPVASFANGIYTTTPVRLIIKDVNANVVSDVTYVAGSAGNVVVNNASWPGETTVDGVLTALGTSLGGVDGRYIEHSGATQRTVQDKFGEIFVSVKDYGAAGDGVTDDTAFIQNAINRVVARAGGVVYFPPGVYKISSALTLAASSTGVVFEGSGVGNTTITQASASTDCLDIGASSSSCAIRHMKFTGGQVQWTKSMHVTMEDVKIDNHTGATGLTFTGATGSDIYIVRCNIQGTTNAMLLDNTVGVSIRDSILSTGSGGSDQAINVGASAGAMYVSNTSFSASIGFKFDSSVVSGYTIVDSPSLSGCPISFDTSALSTDPGINQSGNEYDNELISTAAGVRVLTRTVARTTTVRIISGNTGITINAPWTTGTNPATSPSLGDSAQIEFIIINNGGGTNTITFGTGFRGANLSPSSALNSVFATGFKWNGTLGIWLQTYASQD